MNAGRTGLPLATVRCVALSAVAIATLVALAGCRPLYIPLVPDPQAAPTATRLSDGSQLAVVAGRPRLVIGFAASGQSAQDGAWLDVQWFGPSGAQAASESLWLDGTSPLQQLVFELPVDVEIVQGEWRAVLSLDGILLRQFRADVAVDPEE